MGPLPAPSLPFPRSGHAARLARLRARPGAEGHDAMLVFAPENLSRLTGYDSGGYVFLACAVVTANDRPLVLLTRRPDLPRARQTSTIEDIRIWWDAEDANPARDLKAILGGPGLAGGARRGRAQHPWADRPDPVAVADHAGRPVPAGERRAT